MEQISHLPPSPFCSNVKNNYIYVFFEILFPSKINTTKIYPLYKYFLRYPTIKIFWLCPYTLWWSWIIFPRLTITRHKESKKETPIIKKLGYTHILSTRSWTRVISSLGVRKAVHKDHKSSSRNQVIYAFWDQLVYYDLSLYISSSSHYRL